MQSVLSLQVFDYPLKVRNSDVFIKLISYSERIFLTCKFVSRTPCETWGQQIA